MGFLAAQEPTHNAQGDPSAMVNNMLAKMSGQLDIPEIPEGQRASREQIDKLFEALRLRDQLNKTMEMTSVAVKAGIQQAMEEQKQKSGSGKELTPEQQKLFENVLSEYTKKLAAIIYSDDVINPIKSAYQRYLTASDVEGIIAFYQTSAGEHLLERQTKIGLEAAPQMLAALQGKLQPLMEEMQKNIAALDANSKKSATTK
jgi:hypothetical protein